MSDIERYRESVEACAVHNLRRTARVVTRRFDDALRPAGLKATQLNVLIVVWQVEGARLGSVARLLAMDRTTLARNVRLLERRGLVAIRSDGDQRERRLALTDQGRAALEVALPLWERVQSSLVEGLGGERWTGMLADLRALSRSR